MIGADGKKTTAELPIAFEFHLPYRTTDGSPTKLCVGCGPDVLVNMILGLPFVLTTKMVIEQNAVLLTATRSNLSFDARG
jgi:hypothetical protein